MKSIIVLKGGSSPERDVSLVSGNEIATELRKSGYLVTELDPADYQDFASFLVEIKKADPLLVFNGLHGGSGENGEMQAALTMAGFICTGSGFKPCCITMDKYVTKLVVAQEGIPTPKHILMRGDMLEDYIDPEDYATFTVQLGLPIIVKPNDGGSSVGISRVDSLETLKPAVQDALKVSSTILLEEYIPGRELTVTVLDGKALPVVEIKPLNGWYDYNNKYNKGRTEYFAPAELDESVSLLIQLYAVRIWKALELSGYARIDFRYDDVKAYFLEVNTLPGMTPLSLTPMAAKAAGITFGDLLNNIIEISLRDAGR
ncbi:MAG: D-alanine--D-alanine ligase [Candidatus Cloacimonetes bacterium HGW-Cloacimonetes-3]|jgi:D-alanine-D-alanine ligase|nr:MAG: D-alanine--D-alanine ligase [Candidatus Cloacimonetes bacterium HGW-Cloacimonetes-3]